MQTLSAKRFFVCVLGALTLITSTAIIKSPTVERPQQSDGGNQPGTIYLATIASSGSNAQDPNLQNAVGSITNVASRFGVSVQRIATDYDSGNPQKSCANDKGTVDNSRDLLVILRVISANQSANKYTGTYSQSASLSIEQIYCPSLSVDTGTPTGAAVAAAVTAAQQAGVAAQLAQAAATTAQNAANAAANGEKPAPVGPAALPGANVHGISMPGNASSTYIGNPVSGIGAVAALLTSPWVNRYRLWLTVPSTVVDSFRHEQQALEGAIYCASAQATINMMLAQSMIEFKRENNQLHAFRINGNSGTETRVSGVNVCRAEQPSDPKPEENRLFVYTARAPAAQ